MAKSKFLILIITSVFVVLFILQIDITMLKAQMETFGWRISVVCLLSGMAYLFATMGWILCFGNWCRADKLVSYFHARQIGESFSLLNPFGAVGGDALKVTLTKEIDRKPDEVLASVICSRVVMWVAYFLLLIGGIISFLFISSKHSSNLLTWIGVIGLLGGLCLLLVRSIYNLSWLQNIVGLFSRRYKSKYLKLCQLRILSTKRHLHLVTTKGKNYIYLALLFFVIHYLFGALEFYYILYVLGEPITLTAAILGEIGTSLIRSIMIFIPGQVGVEEYSNKYFLELAGVKGESTWVTVSLIRRMRQIFWILFSIIVYVIYFQKSTISQTKPNLI